MHQRFLRTALLTLCLSALLTLAAGAAYDGVALVTVDKLALRAEPKADAEVLTQAAKDDVLLAVLSEEPVKGWREVDFGTYQGFVPEGEVTVLENWEGALGYGKLDTNGDPLNVRSGPGTDCTRLTAVPASAKLTLKGMKDGWFLTEYAGFTGYVCGEYITAVREDGTRADAPAASALGLQIVEFAKTLQGVPYVYGGSGPKGFDCSGLVWYVYNHFGYSIPRGASSQMRGLSQEIPLDQIQPGDLVFFRRAGSTYLASHVGIYVGDGMYIHAPQTGDVVRIVPLVSTAKRPIVGVRRVI